MQIRVSKSKAQSISEYVVVIGLVSAALVGMRVYMQRGIQAVIKHSADQLGSQKDAEEIDVNKGTKKESWVLSHTHGAPKGDPNLGPGETQRVRVFWSKEKEGEESELRVRRDFYTRSKRESESKYISLSDAEGE